MKCPHCGMNIRDNVTECGYCGGEIARRPEKPQAASARGGAGGTVPRKSPPPQKSEPDDDGSEGEEEEGGLSAILHPGEQVLIGSLNVSVKKFSFHAYLTNQRIFLIDTQEKKLKVTAKDVPRNTIVGSIVEFSENSDPVLVLSIKSGEDEDVKTLKLVFSQNGMDRSSEIDEWIALLQEGDRPRKGKKPQAPVREPEPEEEEPEPEEEIEEPPVVTRPAKPPVRQELTPARKPAKEYEKQPPVKRIQSPYRVQIQEPEPEPEVLPPVRKPMIRPVAEPVQRPVITPVHDEEDEEEREPPIPRVRTPEVQSAMKVAMKGAARPQAAAPATQPVKRMIAQPVRKPEPEPEYVPEPEPEIQAPPAPVRKPATREVPEELRRHEELAADSPQFCFNCGKKLPHSANFCPGCGTKLSQHRTLPHMKSQPSPADRKTTRTDPPVQDSRPRPDIEEEEEAGEMPAPVKPPVRKAPKGSEMTILHKFLRR